MHGPFYHVLLGLPIFAIILLFVVMPILQWISVRLYHRSFVPRFSGFWHPGTKAHRQDVFFSVAAFILSLALAFAVLQVLIEKGFLLPLG